MKNINLEKIIRQAIDIHVHIGPEIIPRKYTAEILVKAERGKIGGFVLKNHFYPTSPFVQKVKNKKGLKIFGSVVLNNAVGALNPEAIYASSLISNGPVMVWFPTINAKNFLRKSEFEIAPEWIQSKNFITRESKDVKPVELENKRVIAILKAIKGCNAVLATGHISWQESVELVELAQNVGVKNIVITHPIYQKIDMPISIQKKLAKKGCYMEQSYSMYSIDKIPINNIVEQIKFVGAQSVILSSDVGQKFSPSPSKALYEFSTLLLKEGVTENELFEMLVTNPKKLLNIA